MSYKQIQLMQEYLITNGIKREDTLNMTVPELIDKYYEMKIGVDKQN